MLNDKIFRQSLFALSPKFKQQKFLLAISGGADSMVLLHLFKGLNVQVAHVNYKLREKDSDLDQKLVENICKKNSLQFHLYEVSAKDIKPKGSIQQWARDLRYDFFRKIQNEENIDFIVTAHHLNDDLETFILNLSKAAGIKGLSGIPAHENGILRPLLSFSKEDIYNFAKENGIAFREDLSNQQNDYTRNKIRNTIVPQLSEVNVDFLENFGKSISYLKQTRNFVQEQILNIEKEVITLKGQFWFIKKNLFFGQSAYVQFEILRKFGFNENEISKMKHAETGKKFISADFEILIDREFVIVNQQGKEKFKNKDVEITLQLNSENEILVPEYEKREIAEFGNCHWEIDANKITLPLKLRLQQDGDHFHPIGMIGKKKISKFFKDEKLPIFAQRKIWLLCDGKENIIGIIPFRQDRRFAANNKSEKIIKLKL